MDIPSQIIVNNKRKHKTVLFSWPYSQTINEQFYIFSFIVIIIYHFFIVLSYITVIAFMSRGLKSLFSCLLALLSCATVNAIVSSWLASMFSSVFMVWIRVLLTLTTVPNCLKFLPNQCTYYFTKFHPISSILLR